MTAHTLRAVQKLPVDLRRAWDFFSNPANLREITPPHMGFEILSKPVADGGAMYPGQIIEYTVRPVLGIPLYWMTEITHVNEGASFVDEQRIGPYALWHHQHHFRAIDGGVEMTDLVHYKNPGWVLGRLANALFVKRQLAAIFDHRFQRVEALFGAWPGGQPRDVVLGTSPR